MCVVGASLQRQLHAALATLAGWLFLFSPCAPSLPSYCTPLMLGHIIPYSSLLPQLHCIVANLYVSVPSTLSMRIGICKV